MFLIDSSAWIEYLRPKGSPKVKERVRDILKKEEAVTCGIVIVELLRGAMDKSSYQSLTEYLSALPQTPMDETVIQRAAEWGFLIDRRLKTVPTTDLIIGASAYKTATVLHCDSDFELLASTFGLDQERCR
ncbi:MAG: PIN domain-containing protein [Pseudomonadota bacterium]